ncbi:MAG: DUF4886 domain-containing protein [Pseudomonadota bacterium]
MRQTCPKPFPYRWLSLTLVLFVGACGAVLKDRPAAPPALNVLFVGNSFTYYNDSLHNHVRALVRSASADGTAPGRMRALTLSGARLDEHLPGFGDRLQGASWDWVILQGHSREAYDGDVLKFQDSVLQLTALARKHNVRPALFMTWAYTDEPEMTGIVSSNYRLAGARGEAPVVPVGLAFHRATQEVAVPLRHDDQRHPTLAGTYLAACVFYSWLYEQPATGLSYTAGLDPALAAQLQHIASETVASFRKAQRPADA